MKKLILSLVFLSAFTLRGSAQLQGLEVVKVPEAQQPYSGEYIYIPDVEGYKTLKCDFSYPHHLLRWRYKNLKIGCGKLLFAGWM